MRLAKEVEVVKKSGESGDADALELSTRHSRKSRGESEKMVTMRVKIVESRATTFWKDVCMAHVGAQIFK